MDCSGSYAEDISDIKTTDSIAQDAKSAKKRHYDRRVTALINPLRAKGRGKYRGVKNTV